MKAIFILPVLSAILLGSCKKDQEIYTVEVNGAISSQSFAMLALYDIVNVHLNMIDGSNYEGCFTRSNDTIASLVYDTLTVAASGSCGVVKASNTSGWFTAIYPETAADTPGETVTITFNNFRTNGVIFSGNLTYGYISADSIRVTTQSLVMTDESGSTTVTADLVTSWDSSRTMWGNMAGTGAHTYSWTVQQQLMGGELSSDINFGTAIFKAYDRELIINFGNGEDDDFATLEDKYETRRVLNLPTL